ncbi:MAG TPA: proprotein convertase P-domain-containing protein, partial [Bacteroidales bacterium]|nr:proprotein convertase P-domain-containing protein [Bacteroidales bacterium]
KTVKNVTMSVNGDCREGDIRIKITMPNGKTYSDIVIDEYGNLNWRKSFTISETENKDKTGAWKFEISSSKATGFFKISLQTY